MTQMVAACRIAPGGTHAGYGDCRRYGCDSNQGPFAATPSPHLREPAPHAVPPYDPWARLCVRLPAPYLLVPIIPPVHLPYELCSHSCPTVLRPDPSLPSAFRTRTQHVNMSLSGGHGARSLRGVVHLHRPPQPSEPLDCSLPYGRLLVCASPLPARRPSHSCLAIRPRPYRPVRPWRPFFAPPVSHAMAVRAVSSACSPVPLCSGGSSVRPGGLPAPLRIARTHAISGCIR